MLKTLILSAALPGSCLGLCGALLFTTGCPTGDGPNPNEGEGEEGEGEGEGEGPFEATITMSFADPIANLIVNGELDPCADLMTHVIEVIESGAYVVKPTPSDNRQRCAAKTIEVDVAGDYAEDFTSFCGQFPNGEYEDDFGTTDQIVTTDDGDHIQIHGSFVLPPSSVIDIVVTGNDYYGEGETAGGQTLVVSGTISDDLCEITFREVRGGVVADDTLHSTDPSCP